MARHQAQVGILVWLASILLAWISVDARVKAKVLNAAPEKVFEAARRAAADDLRVAISRSDEQRLTLEFRLDADGPDPGRRPLSERWSGFYVRVSVEPTTGGRALLAIDAQRVYPLTGSSVSSVQKSPHLEGCEEKAFAEAFLGLVKAELGQKRRPKKRVGQFWASGCR